MTAVMLVTVDYIHAGPVKKKKTEVVQLQPDFSPFTIKELGYRDYGFQPAMFADQYIFNPVWHDHPVAEKIYAGRKSSYYYLMGSKVKYAISYGLRN